MQSNKHRQRLGQVVQLEGTAARLRAAVSATDICNSASIAARKPQADDFT